jgi:hypothetical protein
MGYNSHMRYRLQYMLIGIAAIAIPLLVFQHFKDMDEGLNFDSPNTANNSEAEVAGTGRDQREPSSVPPGRAETEAAAPLSEPLARGIFGSPIGDPYETYLENIESAQAGDANAQFQISRVLFDCKGLPTQSRLDELEAQAALDRGMVEETQMRLDICIELINEVGNDAISDWKSWLAKSAEQGHPLALGRDMVFSPGKYSQQQAEQIVRAVVRVPSVEIYSIATSYFATYREDDLIRYEAWLALACRQLANCNIDEYRGAGAEPLRPDEKVQVEKLVDEIAAAIDNRNWESIGF